MNSEDKAGVLKGLLPDHFLDWNAVKTVPLTLPKDLYSYIDGGAELYISYGFGEAISRTYRKEDQIEVVAEIYDLLEPRNAFGVFSQVRETENFQLGQGAYVLPGAVFFWKGRYYISLSAWESTPEAEDFIRSLGAYIDERIAAPGSKPQLLELLPEEGLIPFAYLYFHHYIWLNSYYFISHEDILKINDNTDAVLAKYTDAGNRKYLLLVQYDNRDTAAGAFASFGREFFPEGLTGNCIQFEDKSWMAAALDNHLILAVFNAGTSESASQLLTLALRKLKSQTGKNL